MFFLIDALLNTKIIKMDILKNNKKGAVKMEDRRWHIGNETKQDIVECESINLLYIVDVFKHDSFCKIPSTISDSVWFVCNF